MYNTTDDTNDGNIDGDDCSLTQGEWEEIISLLKEKIKITINNFEKLEPMEQGNCLENLQRLLYMDIQSRCFDKQLKSHLSNGESFDDS